MSTKPLIPKKRAKLAAEGVLHGIRAGIRLSAKAFEALQAAGEQNSVDSLAGANAMSHHAKRKTLMPEDVQLAQQLRNKRVKK